MTESRKELEQRIIEKAIVDENFRSKLKDNPRETVEETLGVKLPDGLNIHINQEGPNDIHISLPMQTGELNDGELSGEQLTGVSGGWSPCAYSVNQ